MAWQIVYFKCKILTNFVFTFYQDMGIKIKNSGGVVVLRRCSGL